MVDEHRFELTAPFTVIERGRYEAVHGPDGWHIKPVPNEWDGFPLDPGATITAVIVKTERFEVAHAERPDGALILDLPMRQNDAGAATIRDYLLQLLHVAMDIKAPFGNSGWEYDLYEALARAGFIQAERDDDGFVKWASFDKVAATAMIEAAIGALQ